MHCIKCRKTSTCIVNIFINSKSFNKIKTIKKSKSQKKKKCYLEGQREAGFNKPWALCLMSVQVLVSGHYNIMSV